MVSIKNSNMKYSGQWRLTGLLNMSMAGVLLAAPAFAQTDAERINELERKLERSLKMLDDLSSKIDKMEADKKEASGPKNNRSGEDKLDQTGVLQRNKFLNDMREKHIAGREDHNRDCKR